MTRSPIEATVTSSKIKHSDHTVWEIENRSSCLAVYNLQISAGQAHMGVLLVAPPSPFVRDFDLLVLTVTEHNWTIGASNPLSSTQTHRLVEGAMSVKRDKCGNVSKGLHTCDKCVNVEASSKRRFNVF